MTLADHDVLLNLFKYFKDESDASLDLNQNSHRIDLEDEEKQHKFMLSIRKSDKNKAKLTLFCFERSMNVGLFRIDFDGNNYHKNPEALPLEYPEILEGMEGAVIKENHIHIYTVSEAGGQGMDWAIPITNYPAFDVKVLSTQEDLVNAIVSFAKLIKLQTQLSLQGGLF